MPVLDAPPVITGPELDDAAALLEAALGGTARAVAGGIIRSALVDVWPAAVYAGVVYGVLKLTVWNDHYGDLSPHRFKEWAGHLTTQNVVNLQDWTDYGSQVVSHAKAGAAKLNASPISSDPTDVSPQAVQSAQLAGVRTAVARIAAWRRGHRNDVHLPEVHAWVEMIGGLGAIEAAVSTLADADADAWHELQHTVLPRIRTQLQQLIHDLRQDLHAFRVSTDDALQTQRALIVDNTKQLKRGIATEAHDRTQADHGLQLALAPLLSWFGGFGLQTTTKVNKNEGLFDQMLNPGTFNIASLLLLGPFTPLLVRIVQELLPALPTALDTLKAAATAAATL